MEILILTIQKKNQHLVDFFYSIFRGLVIFFQYIKPKFNAWVSKISLPCKVLNLQKKNKLILDMYLYMYSP